MDFKFSKSINDIKFKLIDTNNKTNKRRLGLATHNPIPCKSGCSGCCKRMVKITIAEGMIIYDHLVSTKQWEKVGVEARKQLEIVKNSDPLSWFSMGIECPVLDKKKKTCKAYLVRPAMCASHFVKSNPDLCDPHTNSIGNENHFKPLDFDDLVEEFLVYLINNTRAYGVLQVQLPIPVSLLMAESINAQTGLRVEQLISLMYKEL